ncbi:hypothetical protein EDC04DRAFT_3099154 [Pisolithus marmoratus]|nr:hypothetical protein EDC04DRAFT_3099154 [Pisolithus marmoratus]
MIVGQPKVGLTLDAMHGRDGPDFVVSRDQSNILSCLIWITTAQDGQGDHSRGDARSGVLSAIWQAMKKTFQDTTYAGDVQKTNQGLGKPWYRILIKKGQPETHLLYNKPGIDTSGGMVVDSVNCNESKTQRRQRRIDLKAPRCVKDSVVLAHERGKETIVVIERAYLEILIYEYGQKPIKWNVRTEGVEWRNRSGDESRASKMDIKSSPEWRVSQNVKRETSQLNTGWESLTWGT